MLLIPLLGKKKGFLYHRALENSFPERALQPSNLEDIDELVFTRCCEFVYSGDYSVQLPTLDLWRVMPSSAAPKMYLSSWEQDGGILRTSLRTSSIQQNFLVYMRIFQKT